MTITCPEHQDVIYVPGNYSNAKNIALKNLVVECPICEDEVLINGVFDFDADGRATPVKAPQ